MSGKHPFSRRGLLKGAAAGVATACTPRSPGAGRDTGGDTGGGSGAGSIDHVVMVMMENRSFDHWYGARKLLDGEDSDGLTADMSNPTADGSEQVFPFRSDDLCIEDPPHGWDSSHRQFNDGANDGFCREHGNRWGHDGRGAMGYLTREELPISWALADAYAMCDRYFCSLMTGTWPNRFYGHLGSSQGVTGNDFPPDSVGYTDPSVWEKLDEQGIDWGYYYTDLSFLGLMHGNIDATRAQFVEEFYEACREGTLPAVSWVDPGFSYNDNHPPHHPALGELFIASIHEALATSPLWDRCLIVLTYDEHGGFFDHVPPPKVDDDRAAEGFDQLGFRVPSVIMGPYVKQGVDSTQYCHASWLRWICERHGIAPWTTRIANADPLSGALDLDRLAAGDPRPPAELPGFAFDESTLGPECSYFDRRAYQFLDKLHHRMIARGLPSRLEDRAALHRLFHRLWAPQGLVG